MGALGVLDVRGWKSRSGSLRRSGGPRGPLGGRIWMALCALCVLPLAAIAHHGLFFPTTCMINPFGPEYDLRTVALWLSRDPSLPFAIVVALLAFRLGERFELLRWLVLSFALAFLPLALWIWDVPWTGRVVCMHLHDGRVLLAEGMPLKSRHLYLLGALLQPLLLTASLRLRARHGYAPLLRGLRAAEPASAPTRA